MNLLHKLLHRINAIRLRLLLKIEPKTFTQLKVWVNLNNATDLSYLTNFLFQYLPQGIIWRNTLFRERLLRRRSEQS